ncbi:MAG: hypothetical protein CVV51_04835 [Spirochaetae bacterium HGW-Spirochaetae-7]|jgi:mannitol/fructose-specific phosphotransferase system IIA component (Ntr-type)|nr:MAG: hypothetical protein CVV51_04835 [Spirochaetae bacterium HGW-Spirochaetae-7]
MKSLLSALEKGRLVQLPDAGKEKALELLSRLIEAIPDIGNRNDIMKSVVRREAESNTAIGHGVACPHCRSQAEGELQCAVGWSPAGIDYGAPDGGKVHLVIMYCIPDSQRNAYLKEISGLAKAITTSAGIESISSMSDIHGVRDRLLDWVSLVISAAMPESKARMIKLSARQAISAGIVAPAAPASVVASLRFIPFRLVAWPDGAIVLCADPELARSLESSDDLAGRFAAGLDLELPEYRVAVLAETAYAADRREYEAVAIRRPQ